MALPSVVLPHIDLTKDPKAVEPGTQEWDLMSQTIREALEAYGCFLVSYDNISCDEQEEMFAGMESLFALPVETKRNIERLPGFNATYPGQNPFSRLHQALGIVDAHKPEMAQAFANLMWPDGNDEFRTLMRHGISILIDVPSDILANEILRAEFPTTALQATSDLIVLQSQTMNSLGQKMRDLAYILMKMVFNSFGLEERCCESYLDNMAPLFHMIRYSAPMTDEPTVGATEHVDATFLTILRQNAVGGLSVKTRKGEWLKATIPADKSTFVVQTGLSFKGWSNGRLHVPPHKVTITGHKVRLTCGLFLHAKSDRVIETPNQNADEEHPLLFRPFRFGEFYRFFRARLAAEDSLDVFAGI